MIVHQMQILNIALKENLTLSAPFGRWEMSKNLLEICLRVMEKQWDVPSGRINLGKSS